MPAERLPLRDPRTVARDIPGILDALFPRLNASLVAFLNKDVVAFDVINRIPDEVLEASTLGRAMLFELAVARAEQMVRGVEQPNWGECLEIASTRQRRHFDAKVPSRLEMADISVADWAACNLYKMLKRIQINNSIHDIQISPQIPGYRWIASGHGDFSIGSLLIEVKHTSNNFSSADFRQVLMYWILSYASAIEKDEDEWSECVLLNPRRNSALAIKFIPCLSA